MKRRPNRIESNRSDANGYEIDRALWHHSGVAEHNPGPSLGRDNPSPESGPVKARYEYLARHVKLWLDQRRRWCQDTSRLPDVSLFVVSEANYAITGALGSVIFVRWDNRVDGAAA